MDGHLGIWVLGQANYGMWTQECDRGLADLRAVLVFVLQPTRHHRGTIYVFVTNHQYNISLSQG